MIEACLLTRKYTHLPIIHNRFLPKQFSKYMFYLMVHDLLHFHLFLSKYNQVIRVSIFLFFCLTDSPFTFHFPI